MYEHFSSNKKQTLSNGDSKLLQNHFTKSLTLFHPKNTIPKNACQQNLVKKSGPIKQDKPVKNKRIYLSR